MTKRSSALIFLAIVLLLLLPFAWQIVQPFASPFIVAAALGIVMKPIHNWVGRRMKPGGAALLTTLATVFIIMIPLGLIGFALTQELNDAYDRLSKMSAQEGGWQALVTHNVDRAIDTVVEHLPVNISKEKVKSEALDWTRKITGSVLHIVGAAFGGITSSLMMGIVVIILLYPVLRYGPGWVDRLPGLIPLDPHTTASIVQGVRGTVVANVNGVLAVSACQGFLLGLGFWILGLRSPVTWGLICMITSMIPVVGTLIVWFPVALALLIGGAYVKAGLLALWCILIVGTADNIIRPLVVRGKMNQHPLLVVISVIGGTQVFGALGILLGPLIISLVMALFAEIRKLVAATGEAPTGPSGE